MIMRVRALSSESLELQCETTKCSPHRTDGVEVIFELEVRDQKWSIGDPSVNEDYSCGCLHTQPMR